MNLHVCAENKCLRRLEQWLVRLCACFYASMRFFPYHKASGRLPMAYLSRGTYRLARRIFESTGDMITLISPAPVSLLGFAWLGCELPHIANKFAGLHGGIVVSKVQETEFWVPSVG